MTTHGQRADGERASLSAFDAARCQAECSTRGLGFGTRVEYSAVTDSTNDDALALAKAGASHGVVVVADRQRRGRGRRGSRWSSAERAGLTFSLIVRTGWKPPELSVLPLVVGLAVRQVVAERVRESVLVKWPNDVMVSGRKICGVLVESYSHGGEIRAVVVGVGLNVHRESLPSEIADRAVSLEALEAIELPRELLLAELLEAMERRFHELELNGFAAAHAEFARFDFLNGRDVTVGEHRGVARGIAENGALLLECDGVTQQIVAGTVSFDWDR
jgi:BirA family biotin operon repressor/biotin-[acetyl-CoA-carboxylase] ligase